MASIPAVQGAYVLGIRLDSALCLDIGAFRGRMLHAGHYAYCGSAYGPGGLRARVGRHLRQDKTPRWHVDRLTATGTVENVHVVVGGRECGLVDILRAHGATAPIKGFGSSDCRQCEAHLLSLPGDFSWPRRKEWIELGRTGAGTV